MIVACKTYLRGKLTAAGVPAARITDDPEQGEWPPPNVPYAELLADPERLQRDGRLSAREYDPVTKQATLRRRLLRRALTLRVRIVHKDEAALDSLVTAFLATLERRFADAGQSQWVYARPQQVVWAQGEQPRDRRAAEIRIDFEGGLYTSAAGGTVQQVNVPAAPDIT